MNRNIIAIPVLALISVVQLSCTEATPMESEESLFDVQGQNGFVGLVEGTNAFIAVLVGSDEAIVYVCNGDEAIHEWFKGPVADPAHFSLTNDQGGHVQGTFAGGAYTGNIRLSNAGTHSFTARPNAGDEIGIIRVFGDAATQAGIVAGWVLTEDDERGAFLLQGSFRTTPKIGDLTDGTSNTLMVAEVAVTVERFFTKRSGTNTIIEMNGFIGR